MADKKGVIYILTNPSARNFTGLHDGVAGPRYFKYNGEWLNDIRQRLGV